MREKQSKKVVRLWCCLLLISQINHIEINNSSFSSWCSVFQASRSPFPLSTRSYQFLSSRKECWFSPWWWNSHFWTAQLATIWPLSHGWGILCIVFLVRTWQEADLHKGEITDVLVEAEKESDKEKHSKDEFSWEGLGDIDEIGRLVSNVFRCDDVVHFVDDLCIIFFWHVIFHSVWYFLWAEGESQVVGGDEEDAVVVLLFVFHLFPHLVAHVVANQHIDCRVFRRKTEFFSLDKVLSHADVA